MPLTLLVLAAGMGSRYGGLKQIDPVGPSGETVLDYAVFDAQRAGFDRVVFVIRQEFATLFRDQIGAKYSAGIQLEYVFQSVGVLPAGANPFPNREKPWGTGHAVWCARDAIGENFAVINADDFYGREAFVQLARFLTAASQAQFAMVGFELAKTLSEHGPVSRGICTVSGEGMLRTVVEVGSINRDTVGPNKRFTGHETVSMNCWGFTPALFPALEIQLRDFLTATAQLDAVGQREFYLPAAVSHLVARSEANVRVLPTSGGWFGITYREDKDRVKNALAELVTAGKYPTRLF
ncbi:MAG: sugar phosphate nucleotidyltransferase [Opitutaceae bacterium]